MYTPSYYRVEDQGALHSFMERNSFATLISCRPEPIISHLPFVIEKEPELKLVSHMARANPHWKAFAACSEVAVIFQGPHAYISPFLYESEVNVPTWNYSVVHAYGVTRIREDVDAVLEEMIRFYEEPYLARWRSLPAEYREKMRKGIVAFDVQVHRIEGKFKMSQNRSSVDRENVIRDFEKSASRELKGVAEMMRECGEI